MITDHLQELIQQGCHAIGELEFAGSNAARAGRGLNSGYRLYHAKDRDSLASARVYREVADAREIARFDGAGNYRPLKGAPNLPRGWVLELPDLASLKQALDQFY